MNERKFADGLTGLVGFVLMFGSLRFYEGVGRQLLEMAFPGFRAILAWPIQPSASELVVFVILIVGAIALFVATAVIYVHTITAIRSRILGWLDLTSA